MRLFLCLSAVFTTSMVLLAQQREQLIDPVSFVFRDKCTIEYVDHNFTVGELLEKNNPTTYSLDSTKNISLENARDSIPNTKRTKLRLDPTFELGMQDAKKYYKLRYHKVANNPKNPNNMLLTQDVAYNSGYLWGIQKKHDKLRLVIITFSILIAAPLVFIVFLSIAGTSGGWWL